MQAIDPTKPASGMQPTAMPGVLAASTPAPAPPPAPATGVLAQTGGNFDFSKAAGTTQGPTNYQPTSNSLVSEQLNKLLSKGGAYLQAARTRAMQQANSRGVLNSSMAAGAGELAAIEAGRPIAEGDATAYMTAERDNNMNANTFARDSNQFGRENAQLQYRGILDMEAQGRDQSFRAGESALEREQRLTEQSRDQTFRTGERIGAQDFGREERVADQTFRSGEAQAERTWRSDESGLDRAQQVRMQQLQEQGMDSRQANEIASRERMQQKEFEVQAERDTVAFGRELERMGFANNLANANIPVQFAASMATNLQSQIATIQANDQLTPEAKQNAITNLVNSTNTTLTWAEGFFGGTFNRFGTADAQAPAGPVGPPAPAGLSPAPAPAPAPQQFTQPGNRGGGTSVFNPGFINPEAGIFYAEP
jgi:hypothetical protein